MVNIEKFIVSVKKQAMCFFSDRRNIYMLIMVFLIPIIYEGFRFTPIEGMIEPNILNDYPTRWLQEKLGTDTVYAYFASYYYFIPHLFIMAGLAPMFFFARRMPPWFYLFIAIVIFMIDTSFYFIYPVAPPCRLNSEYIEPIRINLFPFSDSTISVHYSALPSGHIFISMIGVLISYLERWKKVLVVYAFNTVLMSMVVVYTGDHYVEDTIASTVLVLGVFLISLVMFKRIGWMRRMDDGSYISTSRKE
ncbi:MAG TPA: phosphatase PAP2 family protein [Candidatus Methanofastidiosa archaeon]|nr:phosphatase PAP2 family protein [Candidatus Methanofastidiosa archaeon]